MTGNKNLRDLSKLPAEKAQEISSKGGKRSAKRRRELKTMREYAKEIAAQLTTITDKDGTTHEVPRLAAVVAAQYQRAITDQDTRAAEFIATMLDELKQQTQVVAPSFIIQVSDPKLAEALGQAVRDKA